MTPTCFVVTLALVSACGHERERPPAPLPAELLAQLARARDAVPENPSSLPRCPPDSVRGHLRIEWTSLLAMAAVPGHPAAPAIEFPCSSWNDLELMKLHSQYRLSSTVKEGAALIAASRGFAVLRAEHVTEPGADGRGRATGHVVIVGLDGRAECMAPVEATNGDAVSVEVRKSAYVDPSGSARPDVPEADRRGAWRHDLDTRSCEAARHAIPGSFAR